MRNKKTKIVTNNPDKIIMKEGRVKKVRSLSTVNAINYVNSLTKKITNKYTVLNRINEGNTPLDDENSHELDPVPI